MNKLLERKGSSKIKLYISFIDKFCGKMGDSHIGAYSAQASFFILLSVVPLASLLLAVATYLPFSQQDVLELLMQGIPGDLIGYVAGIITDLYGGAGTTVISLSAITMLWSSSKGIAALMDGFNSMYDLKKEYNSVKSRGIAVVYTILLIIMFAIVMSAYVSVAHYYKLYVRDVFTVDSIVQRGLLFIRHIMGWFLFYAFILMMYVILPGGFGLPMGKEEKVNLGNRIRSQIPGAAFAAVAWLVISRAVAVYIEHFPNLSVMYGSLAGIVIIMLWLYFCMYSVFIGAVINSLLSKGYLTRVKKMLK